MSHRKTIEGDTRERRGRRRAFGCLLVAGAWAAACTGGREAPAAPTAADVLARDRAADDAVRADWASARAALRPLVDREDAAVEDLLRAANVELAEAERSAEERVAAASPLLDRAERRGVDDPRERAVLLWCRYRVAHLQYERETELALLEDLRERVPDDVPVLLALATALQDLNRLEEAERAFDALLALGDEFTGAWRMAALNRMRALLMTQGRVEEANRYVGEIERRQDTGQKSPGEPAHQAGTLGAVLPHTPTALHVETPAALTVAAPARPLVERAGILGGALLRPGRPAGDGRGDDLGMQRGKDPEELWAWRPEPPALLVLSERGPELFARAADGAWTAALLADARVVDAAPFDRANVGAQRSDAADRKLGDRDPDLLVLTDADGDRALRLLENVDGAWSLSERAILEPRPGSPVEAGGPSRIVPLDHDHDGDVDVLLTLPDGVRLLRNDGFDSPAGALTDVTAELDLPRTDVVAIPEDLDGDNDVDVVFLERGGGRVRVWDNRRGGVLVEDPTRLPGPDEVRGRHVVVADLNGNGRADLAVFGDTLRLFLRTDTGAWRAPVERALAAPPSGPPIAVDWDLDGTTDLVWPTAARPAAGILAPGCSAGAALELGAAFDAPRDGPAAIRVVDLDGDHAQDLVRFDERGVLALSGPEGRVGRGALVDLVGDKDNARGIGAIVEVRDGLRYRRIYWRGEPELVGQGDDGLDLVRVTWPNAIRQTHDDLAVGKDYLIWQRQGLVGSCPFLYSWNGETYEFISDVIGITPLGLPMAPGRLVPPDHDEYVLVRGDQLRPREGFYELQLTEELREVAYIDRVRLDVVDHPADVEVFPNERFTFPPFPEPHTHTVRAPLSALSARDGDGRDWTAELAANDEVFAFPFEPLGGQYRGLATPHVLELEFDAARVRAAGRLRLLMNGWLFWTDASVNVAAARHPEHAFVPPILQVPDDEGPEGGWKDAGPPLGFPAGKLKTMVVDVTDRVDRERPRLRIFSTLRLYWDSIRLAVDGDDAPLAVTAIEPASARLWERGFSEPIPLHGEHRLEWFEWDRLAAEPRWDQHPGFYTRLGDCLPLVTAIDDRFVVMGSGDALTLRFDASQAPPLAQGWTRDFLLFVDGWAKDRDPNTLEALHVEPLPFHGMSGYPYGPGETFPDDEAHRAWRRDWLTRPARRWIEPLAASRGAPLGAPLAGRASALAAADHEPDPAE